MKRSSLLLAVLGAGRAIASGAALAGAPPPTPVKSRVLMRSPVMRLPPVRPLNAAIEGRAR